MNEHDSEKVAGVLLSRGYRQVESADTASLILYTTCSIREKAAQKTVLAAGESFATGTERRRNHRGAGIVGAAGRPANFSRAPWVSLVCGSASYRKLPEMLSAGAGTRRVTGLDNDTDETFETEVTRRDNPWRAYLTIIEGCDKTCAYAWCRIREGRAQPQQPMRFCEK